MAGTTVIRDGIQAKEAFLRGPQSIVMDSRGNLYVADADDNRIRRIGTDGVITTIAGDGVPGFGAEGSKAATARVSRPSSLAIDRTGTTLYFADSRNFRVRRINLTTGELTTVAGNGTPRHSGDGELAIRAGFNPFSITLDAAGANLYICDNTNARVRKVDLATGVINTFAGNGTFGFGGDNQSALNAQLAIPQSVALDADYAYIADWGVSLIRRVDLKTNIITTWGGCGIDADFGDNGPVGRACFVGPDYLSTDADGNLLVIDGNKIRMIAAGSGIVTAVAGSPSLGFAGDGTSTLGAARFALPGAIVSPRRGEYVIADTGNYRIRQIKGGELNTIAGSGAVDGRVATATAFNLPTGVARDSAGNLYIADTANHRIRKVAAGTNLVSTIAGTGVRGTLDGRISGPSGVAATPDGTVYFSDTDNNRVYRIGADGVKVVAGAANGTGGFSGDGQVATSARLRSPRGLALDANGNLFIADWDNGRVRRVNASDNAISTVAGSGAFTASGDGGPALAAGLSPADVAVDSAGNLYIADDGNSRIRKVTAGSNTITTILGGSGAGYAGDGGPADRARILMPQGVAIDAQNNLFVADFLNFNVRRVDGRTNVVTTIAGNGLGFSNSETGQALAQGLTPIDVVVEPNGNLLIADSINDRVRRLTPLVPRTLTLVSGNNATGQPGGQTLLTVKATDASGANVAGVLVTFVVVSGDVTLRPAAAQTAIDGTASAQVTFGERLGAVTVRADSAGLPSVTFTLTNAEPVPVKLSPVISRVGGVSGMATRLSATALAAIEGVELAPAVPAKMVETAADLVEGKLPTRFNGACVDVSGVFAPLLSVSPTRIVFQVPEAPSPTASVKVIAGCGTANEFVSDAVEVSTAAASPEFFLTSAADGGGKAVVALNLNSGAIGSIVQPGDDVIVYLTGAGPTDPATAAGAPVADNLLLKGSVTLNVDGKPVDVLYAGTTAEYPGSNVAPAGVRQNVGIIQVRFVVPADAAEGNLALSMSVGDETSAEGAVLQVRKPAGSVDAERLHLKGVRPSQEYRRR